MIIIGLTLISMINYSMKISQLNKLLNRFQHVLQMINFDNMLCFILVMANGHDIIMYFVWHILILFFFLSSCFSSSPHMHRSLLGGVVRIRYRWENAWKRKRIYIILFFVFLLLCVFFDCEFWCWLVPFFCIVFSFSLSLLE